MKELRTLWLLTICMLMVLFSNGQSKINGISLWSDEISREAQDFAFIERSNANWVSIQPYGILFSDSTGVEFNKDSIWECSSFKGLIKHINILHEQGYKVFLKPHLILKYDKPGAWVGNLELGSKKNWKTFEDTYFKYIKCLADIADTTNVEMFSIGTEVGGYARKRKKHFRSLIDTVRSIYSGKLTYCANFDAYQKFPFWEEMDLIGIDAYFTVDDSPNTRIENCWAGWSPIRAKLKSLSERKGKPVFFAEFGYTSSDYCAYKAYGGHGSTEVNLVAQANAYRAVFDVFWNKEWFAGGFSWFWLFDNDQPENYDNVSFSPQNKPAEDIISKLYHQYK